MPRNCTLLKLPKNWSKVNYYLFSVVGLRSINNGVETEDHKKRVVNNVDQRFPFIFIALKEKEATSIGRSNREYIKAIQYCS